MPLEKSIVDIDCLPARAPVQTGAGTFSWLELLRHWKVTGFRNWFNCDYRARPCMTRQAFDSVRNWAKLGFNPTVCLANQSWPGGILPTITQARDCAKRLADIAGDIPHLRFEVGNEPNLNIGLASYWPGQNAAAFVERVGNPMYEALHAAGIEVVSASVVYSIDYLKTLLKAGLQFDALGFHPYRPSAIEHASMLIQVASLAGGKPVDLTEWNLYLGGNYRANFDPKHALCKTPKRSAAYIIDQQHKAWAILKTIPAIRNVAYFMSTSPGASQHQWKHNTGPLCLIETTGAGKAKTARTTVFAEKFFALAQV